MSKSIAIMQPTYLPWSGYFSLIDSVDQFVFLDHVQFARRSWQQRNRILQKGKELWLSIPVVKSPQNTILTDIRVADIEAVKRSHIEKIRHSYGSLPYYTDYIDDLQACYDTDNLVELNIRLITLLMEKIGIDTPVVRSSEMSLNENKALIAGRSLLHDKPKYLANYHHCNQLYA